MKLSTNLKSRIESRWKVTRLLPTTIAAVLLGTTGFADPIHTAAINGDNDFFRNLEPKLRKGLDHVRRAENGLVYNPPANPQCAYGFTDIAAKTGHLLFTSLLYYQACVELDNLQKGMGGDHAVNYRARADLIHKNLSILWDDQAGMYLAADEDCRQIDI